MTPPTPLMTVAITPVEEALRAAGDAACKGALARVGLRMT
jgi:hypothetical protein